METICSCDDVATAISKVVHCKKSLVNGKIFNIVGENYKISNIGEIIKKISLGKNKNFK